MAQRDMPTPYQRQQERLVPQSPGYGERDSGHSFSATQDFTESTLSVSQEFLSILQSLQASIMARHEQGASMSAFEEKTSSFKYNISGHKGVCPSPMTSPLGHGRTHPSAFIAYDVPPVDTHMHLDSKYQ
jgi:hypothetical protein